MAHKYSSKQVQDFDYHADHLDYSFAVVVEQAQALGREIELVHHCLNKATHYSLRRMSVEDYWWHSKVAEADN